MVQYIFMPVQNKPRSVSQSKRLPEFDIIVHISAKLWLNLKKAHTIVSKVAIGPTVAKFLDEGQAEEFWDTFRIIAEEKSKQKFNYLCLDFKRQLLLLRRL